MLLACLLLCHRAFWLGGQALKSPPGGPAARGGEGTVMVGMFRSKEDGMGWYGADANGARLGVGNCPDLDENWIRSPLLPISKYFAPTYPERRDEDKDRGEEGEGPAAAAAAFKLGWKQVGRWVDG
ncbi:hypothetical protein B0T17DRAFT_511998 [Bombardia bombarda]|uniref:Uncharacterized protein n=1 Tax=Bombardia bombarda TaxID=252184 RepID=A0AA39U402_9PEZI|nr:hypothetical protein B0T17DRAFT_511998 [Bombardia bombarda]